MAQKKSIVECGKALLCSTLPVCCSWSYSY